MNSMILKTVMMSIMVMIIFTIPSFNNFDDDVRTALNYMKL